MTSIQDLLIKEFSKKNLGPKINSMTENWILVDLKTNPKYKYGKWALIPIGENKDKRWCEEDADSEHRHIAESMRRTK